MGLGLVKCRAQIYNIRNIGQLTHYCQVICFLLLLCIRRCRLSMYTLSFLDNLDARPQVICCLTLLIRARPCWMSDLVILIIGWIYSHSQSHLNYFRSLHRNGYQPQPIRSLLWLSIRDIDRRWDRFNHVFYLANCFETAAS